ncbi:Superfamily II DNA and RNA helicase [Thermoplasmatales archaeon BRNA1]|nr:Superfamily II DNA and RNA helicase [Thermoplasmatales archaeon BRNA1]
MKMISKFLDLGLTEDIAKALDEMGWDAPTPIQEEAVPRGLNGYDLIAQAQTGTGKTGTFGTIILSKVPAKQRTPSAIVLTPTRELALQVAEEIGRMSKYTGHVCLPIYGGSGGAASIERQVDMLEKGVDIVAGTPGRVRDLIEREYLNLSAIRVIVMDESDRMLDMGFMEDVKFIFDACPAERQMMMFSATMPEDIKMIAADYMKKPREINVSQDEVVLDNIKQYYISVGRRNKSWALARIIDIDNPKALIFCQTIKMVDMLEDRLKEYHYKVEALHGDMPQKKRERVMDDFRDGKVDILIATDVAARGLDVDDVNYVVNYDMPDMLDTYIHRIGRTGRAGKEGIAVSFVTSQEEYLVREFERRTGMDIVKRDVPEAEEGTKDTIRKVTDYDQLSDPFGMVRFEISLGKDDNIGKVKLADYIMRAGRIMDNAIGKIQLGKTKSMVEVHKDFGNRMLMDVPKMTFRGKKVRIRPLERGEELNE